MRNWLRAVVTGVVVVSAVAVQAQAQTTTVSPKKVALVKEDLKTSDGKDAGSVTLRPAKNGVKVSVKLKNLPVGDHAIHIHAVAKCDPPDFKTAGPHFNPDEKKHGFKNPAGPHNGDMPLSLTVGPDGTVNSSFIAKGISLDPDAPNSVFANGGTSIVVHEHADDMMTDPSGNSGNRIACGVITR